MSFAVDANPLVFDLAECQRQTVISVVLVILGSFCFVCLCPSLLIVSASLRPNGTLSRFCFGAGSSGKTMHIVWSNP